MTKVEFMTCKTGKIFNDETFVYFRSVIEGENEKFYLEYMGNHVKTFNSLSTLLQFGEKVLASKSLTNALKKGEL